VEKERLEPIILERAINKALERTRLIHELEKARTEALVGASKLTSVIDNSQHTIWLVDNNFKLEAFNKKFSTSIKRKTGVAPRVGFGHTGALYVCKRAGVRGFVHPVFQG
jgi:hypothetical protein